MTTVAWDANSTGAFVGSGTSITDNGLTILSGTLLLAGFCCSASALPPGFGITWGGGQSLIQVPSGIAINATDPDLATLYYLVNPATGNKSLVASWTGSQSDLHLAGISFTGANLVGGATTFPSVVTDSTSTTGTISLSPTTGTGDATVALFGNGSNINSVNNSQWFLSNSGAVVGACGNYAVPGSAPMTMSRNVVNHQASVAVDIAAAAGGDNLIGKISMIQMRRKILGWTPPLVDHRRRQWRRNRSLLIPSNKLLDS